MSQIYKKTIQIAILRRNYTREDLLRLRAEHNDGVRGSDVCRANACSHASRIKSPNIVYISKVGARASDVDCMRHILQSRTERSFKLSDDCLGYAVGEAKFLSQYIERVHQAIAQGGLLIDCHDEESSKKWQKEASPSHCGSSERNVLKHVRERVLRRHIRSACFLSLALRPPWRLVPEVIFSWYIGAALFRTNRLLSLRWR